MLSGGVGGARLARGLAGALEADRLTVIVNVGDDDQVYGVDVSPDLDTVIYTLAEREGPQGWGRADDAFGVMGELEALGEDTTFRLGDRDLAVNLIRTAMLRSGQTLSQATARIGQAFGIEATILPCTDDALQTRVRTPAGLLSFQEYFVLRGHRDVVIGLEFEGTEAAKPAPGVVEAIEKADLVVIGPSNPPLSIWPILAVADIKDAVGDARRVCGVSPLFGGKALKGPAHRVMRSLGLPAGNAGVVAAYDGLLTDLVVDLGDADDRGLEDQGLAVHVSDTRIADPDSAVAFASWLVGLA